MQICSTPVSYTHLRKGDLVHVTAGTVDGYYYVIGIRHDADNKIMTLDLHIPYPEYEKKTEMCIRDRTRTLLAGDPFESTRTSFTTPGFSSLAGITIQ